MSSAFLLRLHRWIFITFAIPLAIIIFTGFILSFQPILQVAGVTPGSITLAQVEAFLGKHDPQGKARLLRVDHFEKTLSVRGGGPGVEIDLNSGGQAKQKSWITEVTSWARPVHEHFVSRRDHQGSYCSCVYDRNVGRDGDRPFDGIATHSKFDSGVA